MRQAVEQHEVGAGWSNAIRWVEMRCMRCHRLLQKIQENALRPGMRIEIKCTHCKVMNYSVGALPEE